MGCEGSYYYPNRSALFRAIEAHYRARGVTSASKLESLSGVGCVPKAIGVLPMDERAVFEKWAESEGHDIARYPAPYTNSEDRNGRYQSEFVQVMWHAWRTRAAHSATGNDNV